MLGWILVGIGLAGGLAVWINWQHHQPLEDRDIASLSRVFIETADDIIYIVSPDLKIRFLNPVFEAHTQWKRSEWIGRRIEELVYPEDWAMAKVRFRSLMDGNQFEPQYMRLRTGGGEEWWGEFKSRPIRKGNRVVGIVGIATNVTLRLQMERELRRNEKFLQEIFMNFQDGLCILDKEMNLIRMNPVLERWFSHNVPFAGRKCYDVFHYRSEPCESCPSQRTLATGEAAQAIMSVQGGPNELPGYIEIHSFPLLDSDTNQLKGVIVFVSNITERLRAERALQDSMKAQLEAERQFKSLVEHTLVGICMIKNDRYLYVNPEMASIFGYSQAEMLALPDVFATVADESHDYVQDLLQRRFQGDERLRACWRGKRKEGRVIDFETVGCLIDYQGERVLISSGMDVTGSLKLEDQLRQAQKMEAVGRLAGGVAHDFNNLLMVITGYCEMLLGKLQGVEPARIRLDLEEILKAGQRGAQLTRQLLAYSRRQLLKAVVLDVNAVIQDMATMLRRIIGENIQLRLELAPVPAVKADSGNLEQVLMNLALNARDAMEPKGGTFTIRTTEARFSADETRAIPESRPGCYVCLQVTDTGTGIRSENLENIFDPFFTTKEMGKGTGLGLSVVYGIVKQHEGFVSVTSRPGEGAQFNVYLPALSQPAAVLEKERPAAPRTGCLGRLLLVEDDEQLCDYLVRALQEYGYTVAGCNDAATAQKKFLADPSAFDLLISDVVLPDRSGFELADALRERNPKLSILMSSGYADFRNQWPLIQERGYSFLQKPCSVADLVNTIEEVFANERRQSS